MGRKTCTDLLRVDFLCVCVVSLLLSAVLVLARRDRLGAGLSKTPSSSSSMRAVALWLDDVDDDDDATELILLD